MSILLALFVSFSAFSADVIMTADEVSNSVSIVNAQNSELIGIFNVGNYREYVLLSSVKKYTQTNVHGLAVSPDKKTLAVTSNISNSVVIYNLSDLSKVVKYLSVGLSPHVSMFSPDGEELWVANRGTSKVTIFDTKNFNFVQNLTVADCPSFFGFMSKKPLVFISNTCTNRLEVFNTKTKKLQSQIELNGTFSPLIALTPDQKELWVIRKDTGEVTRIDTEKMSVIENISVGAFPQHIGFSVRENKTVGLVTVGSDNTLKLYQYNSGKTDRASLVGSVTIPGVPHGVAVSPDGSKAYVAGEYSDIVHSISIAELKIIGSTKIGNSPQSLIYVKDFKLSDETKGKLVSRADDEDETISITLKNTTPQLSGGSISVRSGRQTIYSTFYIYGNFPVDSVFKIYMSESEKNISEIGSKDRKLISNVICGKNKFSCYNSTSAAQDSTTAETYKNKKIKIFALNESGEVVLSNQQSGEK